MPNHKVNGKDVYFDAKMSQKEIKTAIAKMSKKGAGTMSKGAMKSAAEAITKSLFDDLEESITKDAIHTAIKEGNQVVAEALAAIQRELSKPVPKTDNKEVLKAVKTITFDDRAILMAISKIPNNKEVVSLLKGLKKEEVEEKEDEGKITGFDVHPKTRDGKQRVELIREKGIVH